MEIGGGTILGRLCGGLLAVAMAGAPVDAQTGPDFDAVAWAPIACAAGDAAGDEHPASVDLVGDGTFPAVSMARDADFLYFRHRVDGDPSGPGGFESYSWNVLVQVPSGDPFQYQYMLSLYGNGDAVEIWANTAAEDIDFAPLFQDDAETRLFTQGFTATSPANDAPLARVLPAGDGSAFDGTPDYFVDVAYPVPALIAAGVVGSAAELDQALFFPVTSTNPNNYNKGHLDCTFLPGTALGIDETVAPATVPANRTTPVVYTIAVRNDGGRPARGVLIEDPSLPTFLSTPVVTVSSDDPTLTFTVVGTDPLEVRVPELGSGRAVTVRVAADAMPDCGDGAAGDVATASATNAPAVSDSATLGVNLPAGGCAPCAGDGDCDDANACTTDGCVAGACVATAVPGCSACGTVAECDDGDACTVDACDAGSCTHAADPACGAGGGDGGGSDGGEVCGDCRDNDGDGLVDYDDPDCCTEPIALELRRLRLKSTAKRPTGRKLRLKAGYASYTPAGFDPMSARTTVQVSDAEGVVFCQSMPLAAWRHPRKRVFRFRDRTGTLAGGLRQSRFDMRKSGAIGFRVAGASVAVRPPSGADVQVTVAVGGRCSRATAALRARRNVLRFP
ncbi:MAG TPA: hypothetical protein VKA21_04505 [Candidatus Binatia bacterium]|nr:hypothetical protein [Candidatus Binatia bacterium]